MTVAVKVRGVRLNDRRPYTVLIDPEDRHLFDRWTWRVLTSGYVARKTSVRVPGRRTPRCVTVLLHRQIVGLGAGRRIVPDHLNGDPLDNRRANLEVVTHAENIARSRRWTE